ncbi:hypothetical protein [Paenibacillus tianjinensis]|uniref:Spore coat protein n=1 Tax=Paenibacillus tianjinensis TaxID=2810347 RepID=A0ABX7L5F4_9BACL|nr:hypothetical protein [Paenibacillus tianjinensis]QSF43302.1 hypothetical protein JRJ22_18720 [Paenibacillus tianjinensis]
MEMIKGLISDLKLVCNGGLAKAVVTNTKAPLLLDELEKMIKQNKEYADRLNEISKLSELN